MQPKEQEIWDMIEAGVEDIDLRLVRVRLMGGERTSTVQVMIEPQESKPGNLLSVTLQDCENVSRMASALLDVEDPIASRYNLEVSSTGVERPLVAESDFTIFTDSQVKVMMHVPIDGRKKFVGKLVGMVAGKVKLIMLDTESEIELPFAQIRNANLVISDEEMKQLMKQVEG